ncbi:MAG: hypothetical protein RHS_6006 [Robinsoniella sp. RHS]|nr:MAG: hypothetical protein RHS_6006 [Robinsoniella sp. RHS]
MQTAVPGLPVLIKFIVQGRACPYRFFRTMRGQKLDSLFITASAV